MSYSLYHHFLFLAVLHNCTEVIFIMENIADDSFHVHPHHILQNDCTDVVGFAFFIVLTMSGSKFIMPCEVLSNVDNLIIRLWLICSFWLRISASIYMRTEIVAAFEKNIAFSCIKCYNLVYTENRRRKASMPRPPRCRRICGAPQVETFCPNGGREYRANPADTGRVRDHSAGWLGAADPWADRPAHQLGTGGSGTDAQKLLGGRTGGAEAWCNHAAG